MSRSNTARNGKLGVWNDNNNPGAGTKGITVDGGGVGINANFETLDYLFDEHNTDGSHKDDKIGGNNLKNTVVDGATLDVTATSGAKQLKVKAGGIGTTQLADTAVTTAKIADDAIDATKLKDDAGTDANRAVTTNHIRDGAVTTAKVANGAITSVKLSSEIGWQWIYGDTRVAGTAAGNTPSAVTEWLETSLTAVTKVAFFLPSINADGVTTRKIHVRGNAKVSTTKGWVIELTDSSGTILATASGTNASYTALGYDFDLTYTLTDWIQNINKEFWVRMRVGGSPAPNAYMTNLCVYITPS